MASPGTEGSHDAPKVWVSSFSVVASSARADTEEIVVYGDRFLRWDGHAGYRDGNDATRPHHPPFNHQSMRVIAYQIHSVLRCEKLENHTAAMGGVVRD